MGKIHALIKEVFYATCNLLSAPVWLVTTSCQQPLPGFILHIEVPNFLMQKKQSVWTVIRCRDQRRLIWVCNACQCPFCWTLSITELTSGRGDCYEDLIYTWYSGTVSVTNNGHTCQSWSAQTPHQHSVNDDSWFPDDGSVKAARNYCRNIWEHARPWCYTTHPDIRWGYCDFAICTDINKICGKVLQTATGSITSPDLDDDGHYELNVDCLWTVQAPEDYVIRYVIRFYEIEDSPDCSADILMIFEKGSTERLIYCGSSGTFQVEGETRFNILYVQFYSDYSVVDKGFNITFHQLKAPNKDCGEVLTQPSGWITSPDQDGDGLYDFNLNCSWVIETDENKVIAFRLLYIEIMPSDDCLDDRLFVYDIENLYIGHCDFYLESETNVIKTISNVLFVRFISDNIGTRAGFKLVYEQASKRCLDNLTGYNGKVSVTNHGHTCQAWSSQTPHPHSHNQDNLFSMDGTVAEASNYCRDIDKPGSPWCYTVNQNIVWSYCTFRICNRSTGLCGGLIQNRTGVISSRVPYVPYELEEADCLCTIQADENQVIRYSLLIDEEIDHEQCQADALILFEKEGPLHGRTFCGSLYLYFDGETRSNILHIRYYEDRKLMPIKFYVYFEHTEALKKSWYEILTNQSGWIVSPDRDGDNLYDFNVNYQWIIEGNLSSVILLTPVYINIESSPECLNDFILVSDRHGLISIFCGTFDDTEAHIVKSRLNHLHILFTTNEIISARGFNFSYEILVGDDDCLSYLSQSDYLGTVSVTNYGITCQAWVSQTPHGHNVIAEEDFSSTWQDLNYCRKFDGAHLPWCFTVDPSIRWQYCTFSICNGTYQKCEEVIQNRSGLIVSPDYDNDGYYDLNIDCLWIVEAPTDHVIQFHIYFVHMEFSAYCWKDLLQVFERGYDENSIFICGRHEEAQAGETQSNLLYVSFYSDHSIQDRGFKLSFDQVEAYSVTDKECTGTFRNRSGWISSPDKDGDGFYDFNLNCFWTVEVDLGRLIRFQILYVDLDINYEPENTCKTDKIEISDDIGIIIVICGIKDEMFPRKTMETRSNVMYLRFTSNNMIAARGFNLTYMEFARNTDCFDELKSIPYSGTVSVTNNGQPCQAWSDQTPHNHSENRDVLFPVDGSVSEAKNYCRDIWEDGRPWCYTTSKDIIKGFCTLRICNETIQPCGRVLYSAAGTIVPPDSNKDGFYDLNVDCLWIVVAAENQVIRLKIDGYEIEDSNGCHKDLLSIYESGAATRSNFCGTRTKSLEGETFSNKLYVHFYSDESVAFRGFQLTFVQKEVSIFPCGGALNQSFGRVSAPDRDGDGSYDFNLNCKWTIVVKEQNQIKFQILYVILDHCDFNSDYLRIYEPGENMYKDQKWTVCGIYQDAGFAATIGNKLYIEFVSNNLDAGYGFSLIYQEITLTKYIFHLTGEGWIKAPDLDNDGLYDDYIWCIWVIEVPRNNAIELDIHFVKIEGNYPFCEKSDGLTITYRFNYGYYAERFCGSPGRQAKIQTVGKHALVMFYSDHVVNDVGFLLSYNQVNATKKMSLKVVYNSSWIASLDDDLDGQYEYHAHLQWTKINYDPNSYILLKLLYIDIEESRGCINDHLAIYSSATEATICGVGFKKILTILSDIAHVYFKSDHTINRVGFNMSFQEINGVMKQEAQCDVVLTSPSEYLTSLDMNSDGQYDSGQDCEWTIKLDYTKVIVFEVLKQDIYQNKRSSECESDFLEIHEDHRYIGKYCGTSIAPRFTTETNMLYVRFTTGELRSGKGFEAIYFQAEDVKGCSQGYKCLLTDQMIQQDYICDTYSDCPYGDDERFCHFRCPHGCLCTGLSVDCTGRDDCGFNRKSSSFLNQTFVLSSSTRRLDISSNHDMFLYLGLESQYLLFLTHLNLSSCEITDLPVDMFLSMKSLKVLDLSFNKLQHLKAKIFLNQAHLELLLFTGNSESLIIESEAFVGLDSLQYLELSTLQIERISKGAFATLHLKELMIYHSRINTVESVSLDKLDVESIFLNSSTLDTFTESMFHGGTGTNMFVTDEYKYCCVRPLSVKEENCYPQKDEFSSCDDLIKTKFLRPLIVVVGLFAFLINVASLIYRFRYHAGQLKFCYGIAVAHLAVSDSLLGIYLIMIGITDNIFRGIYIFHDESWRGSAWCQLAGVLSSVSCEASVLFSLLITVDRFLVIKYPFGQKRLTYKNGTIIAIAFWGISVFLAVLPLTLPSYFKGEFYSRSGLCLALPLTRGRPSAWGYAFGIFILFNSVACLLIAVGQWKIYREIKTSKKALGDRRSKSTNDSRTTRNLLLVVTTNLLCWLPVELIGVLALADYPIPVNIYSWIAVVVLPINSAVNPVLYTLSEKFQRKRKVAHVPQSMKMKYNLTADDLNMCTGLWKSSAFWSCKYHSPGFKSLTEILGEEWFCRKQRICVAIDICKLLHKLHDWKTTQEDLNIDDIVVKITSQERCKVALLCRPKQMLKLSDQDENMLSLGYIISTLIGQA